MSLTELEWRSVLAPDGRFDEWVRDLSDRSGVYLIRSDPSRFADQLLYIGESHSYDNPGTRRSYRGLYRTLTRHFHGHSWSQGLTYNPHDVLVAVILTTPEQAIECQDALIATYQPRDNRTSETTASGSMGHIARRGRGVRERVRRHDAGAGRRGALF